MFDYILNNQGHGEVASTLIEAGSQGGIGLLRPWKNEKDGKSYCTVNVAKPGEAPNYQAIRTNAQATLTKEAWTQLDTTVLMAARNRLRAVADLRSAGLTASIDGLGVTVFQYERMTDPTAAEISMDQEVQTNGFRHQFELVNLPLPIIQKDFSFGARELAASRRGLVPFDTAAAEGAGRVVAEAAENLLIGNLSTYTFGGGTVYGYINYTGRMTKVMTLPTAGGWLPNTTLTEVLAMKQQSKDAMHYGPWMLYTSPNWDTYLDSDFSAAKGDITLRDRIKKIEGIIDVRVLDNLTGYQMILVQMTSNVIREVIGLDVTTVQWPGPGGFRQYYKTMAILVPQLRSDIDSKTGIVHGTAA